MPLKILLVDDSRLVRTAVSDMLLAMGDSVIIAGEANNGQQCMELLENIQVDLIILDVEMPTMDGIATLKAIRKKKIDVKIIMLSGLTLHGALTTFRALDLGAMDFIPKPSPDSGLTFNDIKEALEKKIKFLLDVQNFIEKKETIYNISKTPINLPRTGTFEILVIGVSTGGPPAIQKILSSLPSNFPAPIIIVQHMPPVFTTAFANRLNEKCDIAVSEACHDEKLKSGHVYIAPGNHHLRLSGDKNNVLIQLDQSATRNSHRPSIDHTLESVAQIYADLSVALIMTGMGNDGLTGMATMKEVNALTLAQDQKSSVIYGMNKRAIDSGVIDQILNLHDISSTICKIFKV